MRVFCLMITCSIFFSNVADAQVVIADSVRNPLPADAFNKMIVQDVTYAIIGEQTPASGIKIDVSKPEATISAVFPDKKGNLPWTLFGFDFKGGITDRNFSLFKGLSNFNTAFEIRPSWHFIPTSRINTANYGACEAAVANKLLLHVQNHFVSSYISSVRDSFYAVARIRRHHLGELRDRDKRTIHWTRDNDSTHKSLDKDSTHKRLVIHFLKKILKNDSLEYAKDSAVSQIMQKCLPRLSGVRDQIQIGEYKDEVFQLYNKYVKLYDALDDLELQKKIDNSKPIWTFKRYWWITVSPYARTEKVNEYYTKHEGRDSLYFKADYQFYYGLNSFANFYFEYPNKIAQLLRGGISLIYANNLTSLSSFNYETRSPFFAHGTAVTEKTKSGTAYNHDDIKADYTGQVQLEYYFLPLNTLVPGAYFSSSLNVSELYTLPKIAGRADDKTQLAFEGGVVFNINSREKDKEKNILSLLFYLRNEDVTDSRRTPLATGIEESKDDFLKRNLSLGIRVGIPVNLPQRSS